MVVTTRLVAISPGSKEAGEKRPKDKLWTLQYLEVEERKKSQQRRHSQINRRKPRVLNGSQ